MVSSASLVLSSTTRMSGRSCMIGSSVQPQRAVKCCTVVHRAFRPHAAAVTLDNPADGSQPDPGSLEFIRMKPLEYLEQLVDIGHFKTYSVIANKDRGFIFVSTATTDLDTSFRPAP